MHNSQIGPAKRLEMYRERSGRSLAEVAATIGIPFPSYVDLELYDNELFDAISLRELALLAKALDFEIPDLFATDPLFQVRAISLDELANQIKQHLATYSITVQHFENKAGWEVEKALDNPDQFLNLNLRALKDVCEEIGISWLSVVRSL